MLINTSHIQIINNNSVDLKIELTMMGGQVFTKIFEDQKSYDKFFKTAMEEKFIEVK